MLVNVDLLVVVMQLKKDFSSRILVHTIILFRCHRRRIRIWGRDLFITWWTHWLEPPRRALTEFRSHFAMVLNKKKKKKKLSLGGTRPPKYCLNLTSYYLPDPFPPLALNFSSWKITWCFLMWLQKAQDAEAIWPTCIAPPTPFTSPIDNDFM